MKQSIVTRRVASVSICVFVVAGAGVAAAAAFASAEPELTESAPRGVVLGPGEACAYFSGGAHSCWASNAMPSRDGPF